MSQWAGGRPRLLSPDDEDFVVATATTRPARLGQPFTRWSLRKLVAYLRKVHGRVIRIGREALRCLLTRCGVTFQRTKTGKESTDPERDAKLDRIEHVLENFPDRVFAFDEFGPLGIRPTAGSCWAKQNRPDRVPATYHRTHGVTYFHGCYSVGDDTLWGVNRRHKGAVNSLAALKSIRAARPDGAPIYVIMDNLSAHKGTKIRAWARKNKVELCFTPTNASWANPVEAHSGRCGSSPSPTPTIRTTPCRPGPCTPTCAGATPTPATEMSWPPNAANVPASAVRKASAGEADRFRQLLDQTGTSNMVSRPSSSSHCSPTSTKPNPEIVARDAALSGLIVTRTVLTPASATDRCTNSVSIALA